MVAEICKTKLFSWITTPSPTKRWLPLCTCLANNDYLVWLSFSYLNKQQMIVLCTVLCCFWNSISALAAAQIAIRDSDVSTALCRDLKWIVEWQHYNTRTSGAWSCGRVIFFSVDLKSDRSSDRWVSFFDANMWWFVQRRWRSLFFNTLCRSDKFSWGATPPLSAKHLWFACSAPRDVPGCLVRSWKNARGSFHRCILVTMNDTRLQVPASSRTNAEANRKASLVVTCSGGYVFVMRLANAALLPWRLAIVLQARREVSSSVICLREHQQLMIPRLKTELAAISRYLR